MLPDPLPLWTETTARLSARLSADSYRRWILPLRALDFSNDILSLEVPNDHFQIWLEEHYVPLIRAAMEQVAGRVLQVRLTQATIIPDSTPSSLPGDLFPVSLPTVRKDAAPDLNPACTFDNFVVGQSNQYAHGLALNVAQEPGRAYNPLFLYGNTGLGKTHLMQAIGHHLHRSPKHFRVVYVTAEKFTNDFIEAIGSKTLARFRKKYRSPDALLIDDIQFLAGKEKTHEEFFHTFNQIFDARKQIILTSDRPPTEMKGMQDRLISRFEHGAVVELHKPDFETRAAILHKKALAFNLSVSDEIITFLAEKIRSSVRRLEGALIRVASLASLKGAPPSLVDIEHLLRDTLLDESRSSISIPMIQQRVSAFYDLPITEMSSRRRPRETAFARQVAMYLSRKHTTASLSEIGLAFGNRDHGTVLYGCRMIQKRASKEAGLRQTLLLLSKQLGQ